MAFEDLFGGGKHTISPEANIVANPNTNAMNQGFDFGGLFSDPNFIRALGETGAAISGPGTIGNAVGRGASNLIRRRQLQKGARETRKENQPVNDQLMKFLFDNKLLGPTEDNNTPDAITIKSDGGISTNMKNVPAKASFASQQPLESVRRSGGDDLPDFSNQPSKAGFDFAGLDVEDIGMLLRAEQQFGELDQRQMKMLLDEKARRAKVFNDNKIRSENLKALGEDRLAKSMKDKRESVAKIEKETRTSEAKVVAAEKLTKDRMLINTEKAKLDSIKNRLNPAESARKEREIKLKENELSYKEDKLQADRDKLGRTIGLKPNEILALDKFSAEQREKIADVETDIDTALGLADSENNRPGAGVVYVHEENPGTDEGWFWFDKPYEEILSYSIPPGLMFNDQPATGNEIIRRAKAANMTVPEFFNAIQQRR